MNKMIFVLLSMLYAGIATAELNLELVTICDSQFKGRLYLGSEREQDLAAQRPFIRDNLRSKACEIAPWMPLAFDSGSGGNIFITEIRIRPKPGFLFSDDWIIKFGFFVNRHDLRRSAEDSLGVSRE